MKDGSREILDWVSQIFMESCNNLSMAKCLPMYGAVWNKFI